MYRQFRHRQRASQMITQRTVCSTSSRSPRRRNSWGAKRSALSTTAAQLSVTGTIGTLPTHGLVVLFDFVYSCRAGQFDTDGESFLKGGARVCRQRPRSSILYAHRPSGT